eukprot:CAMPEP_0177652154 /NCGR_PEP_ID=MMETSP0447-20121125/12957_1 /TAXON_ID=0 /ORGANISM="Stygamoeba regulata, Strain BSH-02190019" /LENGTH=879 /DNA_ID=CAMNT_0019155337 /DNA_START=30 /DNA_END=2669 /DNA_ORIENTATION=-
MSSPSEAKSLKHKHEKKSKKSKKVPVGQSASHTAVASAKLSSSGDKKAKPQSTARSSKSAPRVAKVEKSESSGSGSFKQGTAMKRTSSSGSGAKKETLSKATSPSALPASNSSSAVSSSASSSAALVSNGGTTLAPHIQVRPLSASLSPRHSFLCAVDNRGAVSLWRCDGDATKWNQIQPESSLSLAAAPIHGSALAVMPLSDEADQKAGDSEHAMVLLFAALPTASNSQTPLRCWAYSTVKNAWQEMCTDEVKRTGSSVGVSEPSAREGHTAVVYKDSVYVFGGRALASASSGSGSSSSSVGDAQLLDDLWRLDVKANRWEVVKARGRAPSARAYHSAVVRDDSMLVFGGLATGSKFAHGDIHEFSFVSGRWRGLQATGDSPGPRCGHVTAVWNDKILLHGGQTSTNVRMSDLFAFDCRSTTWDTLKLPSNSPPRSGHVAVPNAGKVLLLGGGNDIKAFLDDYQTVPFSASAGPSGGSSSSSESTCTHAKLLELGEFTDLTIVVNNERLETHIAVVSTRCPHMLAGLPRGRHRVGKSKRHRTELAIESPIMTRQVITKLLEFLYTDEVDVSSLSPQDCLSLCVASYQYKLPRLSWLCENNIRIVLDIQNVFFLLKGSDMYQQPTTKALCMQFILQHFSEFLPLKDRIDDLGLPLFYEVVTLYHQLQTGVLDLEQRKKELDPGPEPPRTLVANFTTICNDTPDSDGKVKLEGRRISFHTAILSEHSRSLARIFAEHERRDGDYTEALGFGPESAMRAESFQAMLRFIYFGDTSMSTLQACDIMEFSRLHGLTALHELVTRKIIEGVTVDTVFSILPVTYLQHLAQREDMVQLRSRCIRFVIDHLNALDLTKLRAYSPSIAIDVLRAIQAYEKETTAVSS